MHIFITGTDTHIGKTLISSWLCLQTGFDYYKPIQTGSSEETDTETLSYLCNHATRTHKERYCLKAPLSPHLAANLEKKTININNITLPTSQRLIVEGAGGLLVPLNEKHLMIDLIKKLDIPVILVASSRLGTINHTLLSLESLKARHIKTLGVILNGKCNQANCDAIAFYGSTVILAQMRFLVDVQSSILQKIPLTQSLKKLFGVKNDKFTNS